MDKVTTLCVLKMGGPYSEEYVYRLAGAVLRHAPESLDRIVCLTDSQELLTKADSPVTAIPLRHGWSGWWSKIELYRPDMDFGPSVYFDLDTLVVGDLQELFHLATKVNFVPLRGFNQALAPDNVAKLNLATGVMVGQFGRFASKVYETFLEDPAEHMGAKRERWKHGDQGFVAEVLGVKMPRLQNFLSKNYIAGKKLVKRRGWKIPPNTRVVAWSGRPRFRDMEDSSVIKRIWIRGGRDGE